MGMHAHQLPPDRSAAGTIPACQAARRSRQRGLSFIGLVFLSLIHI